MALHLGNCSKGLRDFIFCSNFRCWEIDTFGKGVKIQSTAADYCSYLPDADNSTITSERILAEVAEPFFSPATKNCIEFAT